MMEFTEEERETTRKFKTFCSTDPVVNYVSKHSLRLHPTQKKLIETTLKYPHSDFLSSADEIQLLANLCKHMGYKRAIDVGTYTGYAALSMALGMPPDSKVLSCDVTSEYANIGKPIWKEAGVADKIDFVEGPALETLNKAIDNGESGQYDFAFIDADKINYLEYYELCLQLIRPGGLISIDNVLWGGAVADLSKTDSHVTAIREMNTRIANDNRVDVSMLTIADGLTLAFKK